MATQVTENGNLDLALRKFKQKVARDGVPSECKKVIFIFLKKQLKKLNKKFKEEKS